MIADCLPRRTVYYAVTEQEINLLKDHATSACRCHGIMGTLFGTLLTLSIELFWDKNHLEIKLVFIIIILITLVLLFFYSLNFKSKAEEIWENVKQVSEVICEKNKKRGCPKIAGQVREPNGRISRCKTPREAVDKLAIEMRAKRFGLTLQEAKNPLSGTYIGRLCLQGVLTQEQYDAAQKYLQIRNNYLCAKGLPSAVYDEMPSSGDDKARDKWVEFATEQFSNMQEAIKETQCLYRQYNLYAAIQYLVLEDQTLPHLVNSLQVALNALHKYFDRKT